MKELALERGKYNSFTATGEQQSKWVEMKESGQGNWRLDILFFSQSKKQGQQKKNQDEKGELSG